MDERDVKLAAIREWVKQEYNQLPYLQIVHGIRAVLDWSLEAQERDAQVMGHVYANRSEKKSEGES